MSNEETLRKLALQVRNWGKWGPEDEIGTLNYITPEKIAQASRLVTAGKSLPSVFHSSAMVRRAVPAAL